MTNETGNTLKYGLIGLAIAGLVSMFTGGGIPGLLLGLVAAFFLTPMAGRMFGMGGASAAPGATPGMPGNGQSPYQQQISSPQQDMPTPPMTPQIPIPPMHGWRHR